MGAPDGPLPSSTDPLVDALEARLRRIDLIGWAQITARAQELGLSFEDLRLLLALIASDETTSVSELGRISGLTIDAAYAAAHRLRGRGYLHEEQRHYSLSEQGHELVTIMDAAHRAGIQAYVDGLDEEERRQLAEGIGTNR